MKAAWFPCQSLGPQAAAEALLTVTWSASFAGMLLPQAAAFVQRQLRSLAATLDVGTRETTVPATLSVEADGPKLLRLNLADRFVVYKPPGWEVDTEAVPLQVTATTLSSFTRALKPHCHILWDTSHQHGFLHRLDVPSSGLILVAASYRAYYDLQFQLATAGLLRDYVVLCHGWGQRSEVRARVHWWKGSLANAPRP